MTLSKKDRIERIRQNFPTELRALDQWVVWKIIARDGKPTKVPFSVSGSLAASDNPATWASFDAACRAYLNGNYNGVGFMFSGHDPYTGIDFDKCVESSGISQHGVSVDQQRFDWMHRLNSYSEYSQSGTGIHTIVIGSLPPEGRKSTAYNVEMYDRLRFFVVTGDHVPGTPKTVERRQDELIALHSELFPRSQHSPPATNHHVNIESIPQDDQELLRRAFASRNGAAIEALWRGNTSAYNGDESSADLALCNHLAFWTGKDAARMDSLFRQSGLFREKWDHNARHGETYGQGTIARAISITTEVYQPTSHRNGNGNGHHEYPTLLNRVTEPEVKAEKPAPAAPDAPVVAVETDKAPPEPKSNEPPVSTWPYTISDGRLCLLSKKAMPGGDVEINSVPICDFTANITEVGVTEENVKVYTVAGCAVRSGAFSVDIDAELFGDERKLRALLEAASGPKDPVRAGMGKHLGPAIKLMTNDLRQTQRYTRTGWQDGKFLVPGRETGTTSIRLSRKLPYEVHTGKDIGNAIEGLDALVNFVGAENGAIVLAHLFLAPLAHWAGWRNERTGLFVAGRSGTHKTSVAQVAMSIYGDGFMRDENLIKWGEGATRNAVMAYASCTHDMPLLIDNYKPSTGNGSHDFTNLVHNIMEGGEKDRLKRSSQLHEAKPVYCWPLFTGEDVPANDPASLARVLVVHFSKGRDTELLTKAQAQADHLVAAGAAWLDWLESKPGQSIVAELGRDLDATRRAWYEKIRTIGSATVNPLRVATNLATNYLGWLALTQHPQLGEWARRYSDAHAAGLQKCAETMTGITAQSLEANRFVDALREAIGSGRAVVIRDRAIAPDTLVDTRDRDRVIGWNDNANGIYLLPDVALSLLQKTVGLDLGNLSKQTLYDQLDELGMIASKGKDARTTTVVRAGGKTQRVIHLNSIDIDI